MKKILILSTAILALSASMVHAENCGPIVDNAGILKSDLQPSISQLENAGAEAHFYTIKDLQGAPNLDIFEKNLEKTCPAWQGAGGIRKNNLLLILTSTAPGAHQAGIFYGSLYHKALDSSVEDIKSSQMKPRFHDGDFAGGYAAATTQIVGNIKAANTVARGATTIVNEAPTDYSGLWTFFKWLLAILVLGAIGFIIYRIWSKNKEYREEKLEAQRLARSKKNLAVNAVRTLENHLSDIAASASEKTQLGTLQTSLDELTQSAKYDVEADLEAVDYGFIGECYQKIADRASGYINPVEKTKKSHGDYKRTKSHSEPVDNHPFDPYTSSPAQPQYPTAQYPVTYDPYPTYVPVPVIIEEDRYVEPVRETRSEPSYEAPSRRDDDDSGSGSSSSWDSSSSSSDFGGGSSSDFSSSDSGGGGSSDW